jgi:Nucleotidyltransferase of unknown function (DUF6036)
MATQTKDLWSLVLDQPFVDAAELAEAVVEQVRANDLDFRSRLLIRDSLDALRDHWGSNRIEAWLKNTPCQAQLEAIWHEPLGERGFPFLKGQVMEPTRPETIKQMLRDVGVEIRKPVTTYLAGAGSLILQGLLNRRTQDLDFIDEVPKEVRALGERLHELERTHRLELGHVQQHYFPSGWNQRVHSQPEFGRMRVFLVDGYDIFLSKLSSRREKDKQDLEVLIKVLDKETLSRKLKETCQGFLAMEKLREDMEKNWYSLYGEPLPA